MITKEFFGKTVESAVENGLQQLGLSREAVEVEVLDAGSRGFLGLGMRMARVRLTAQGEEKAPEAPVEEAPVVVEAAPVEEAPVEEPAREEEEFEATPIEEIDDPLILTAVNFITELSEKMGAGKVAVAVRTEEEILKLSIKGDNVGVLIGHRGETLDAIQLLTNLRVNQSRTEEDEKYRRVSVDIGGYRARREETLRRLAVKTANRALKSHRDQTLEPMNSYERRIIHAAVSEMTGVTTESRGTEPNRRVVIMVER